MNWEGVSAKWMQLKGSAKQKWGRFTDGDLDYVAGTRISSLGVCKRNTQ